MGIALTCSSNSFILSREAAICSLIFCNVNRQLVIAHSHNFPQNRTDLSTLQNYNQNVNFVPAARRYWDSSCRFRCWRCRNPPADPSGPHFAPVPSHLCHLAKGKRKISRGKTHAQLTTFAKHFAKKCFICWENAAALSEVSTLINHPFRSTLPCGFVNPLIRGVNLNWFLPRQKFWARYTHAKISIWSITSIFPKISNKIFMLL